MAIAAVCTVAATAAFLWKRRATTDKDAVPKAKQEAVKKEKNETDALLDAATDAPVIQQKLEEEEEKVIELDLAGKHSQDKLISLIARLSLDIKAIYLQTKYTMENELAQISANLADRTEELSEE